MDSHEHKKDKKKASKKFDVGHLKSQKFAGMVFCVAVLIVGGFWLPAAAFGNLVMGVTGLYTAFVGGRAWSDMQSLKYGNPPGPGGDVEATEETRARMGINQGPPRAQTTVVTPMGGVIQTNDEEID